MKGKMIVLWIVFFVTIGLSLAYRENSPMYLLCGEILFIAIVYVWALVNNTLVKFRAWTAPAQVNKGEKAWLILDFKNKLTWYPLPGVAHLTLTHLASNKKLKLKVPFYLSAGKRRVQIPIMFDYIGRMDLKLEKISIFDGTGIVGFTRKINDKVKQIYVYPKTTDVYVLNKIASKSGGISSGDDDRFYSDHPGDDPSEIFGFRDYQEGDKLSHVNWKLSARTHKLIIKEMSDPVREPVCLMWHMDNCSAETYSEGVIAIYSMAGALLEAEIPFGFVADDGLDGDKQLLHIESEEELYEAMGRVLSSKGLSQGVLLNLLKDDERLTGYSKIVIVMCTDDVEYIRDIRKIDGENKIELWNIGSKVNIDGVIGFEVGKIADKLGEMYYEIE